MQVYQAHCDADRINPATRSGVFSTELDTPTPRIPQYRRVTGWR
jgi:hypothetical protein